LDLSWKWVPFQAGEWYQACSALGPATRRNTPTRGRLAELYLRHGPSAQRLAFLLTGDRAHAEELVQEAFVRVVRRFSHLRVPRQNDELVATMPVTPNG